MAASKLEAEGIRAIIEDHPRRAGGLRELFTFASAVSLPNGSVGRSLSAPSLPRTRRESGPSASAFRCMKSLRDDSTLFSGVSRHERPVLRGLSLLLWIPLDIFNRAAHVPIGVEELVPALLFPR
jgi:hypothetical protein